jgi:hypothetical protein
MRRLPKWNATRLYREHTAEQLIELQWSLTSDPANANPARAVDPAASIWLYTRETHRRLSAIAQAITWHMADKRRAA